jgi:hypothetical protein
MDAKYKNSIDEKYGISEYDIFKKDILTELLPDGNKYSERAIREDREEKKGVLSESDEQDKEMARKKLMASLRFQVLGNLASNGASMADQAKYDFDVTGITEANAKEMAGIKADAQKNGTFMKAPNGKKTNLNERQWLQVRTEAFKKWFGNWETAAIIDMAERVWDGSSTSQRIDFAVSEKLKSALQDILGKDISVGFITDSDVRHIKKHNGQNESSRGQIDVTPEDMALIPYVMNEFDTFSEPRIDNMGNKSVLFEKRINGTVYVASVERGKNKEQVITMWKKPSSVVNVQAPTPTSGTTRIDVAKIAKNLRDSKNNSSKVVDENGEPMAVYHGSRLSQEVFNTFNTQGGQGFTYNTGAWFTSNRKNADSYARNIPVYEVFLNIRDPRIFDFEGRNWNEYKPTGYFVKHGNGEEEWRKTKAQVEKLVREGDTIIPDYYESDTTNEIARNARRSKKDGAIMNNVRDTANNTREDIIGNDYTVFSPSQIKSATDNNGNFDEADNDIRYSKDGKDNKTNGELEEVNERFNAELKTLTPENANGKLF